MLHLTAAAGAGWSSAISLQRNSAAKAHSHANESAAFKCKNVNRSDLNRSSPLWKCFFMRHNDLQIDKQKENEKHKEKQL